MPGGFFMKKTAHAQNKQGICCYKKRSNCVGADALILREIITRGRAMQRRQAIAATIGFCHAAAFCNSAAQPAHSPVDSAMTDVDLMGRALKALHPGIYRYQTEAALDAGLAQLRPAFAAGTSLAERYSALSVFLARIRCGHTYANFYNQSDAVKKSLLGPRSRLPFSFTWLPGPGGGVQMVVLADQGDQREQTGRAQQNRLARGEVVQTINGAPALQVFERLRPFARVDGNNPDKQRALLSVRSNVSMEFFDVFHGLVFGAPAAGEHVLVVLDAAGRERRVELPAITSEQRSAPLKNRQADPAAPEKQWGWQWRMQDGVGILTMPNWALYNTRWDWKAWLHERLDALAADPAARGLVVDIRECEGGLDCGNEILSRFIDKPLAFNEFRRLVRFREVSADLAPHLDTWNPGFKTLGQNAQAVTDNVPHSGGASLLELPSTGLRIEPRGMPGGGPLSKLPAYIGLRVLTSANNSSATHTFATRVRAAKLGLMVGQTTGGNQRGINADAFFFVRLPQSGLSFDLPLISLYPRQPMPDAGLAPDIAVPLAAADIAQGRDATLAAALRSI
jgi:Peptidase family S41